MCKIIHYVDVGLRMMMMMMMMMTMMMTMMMMTMMMMMMMIVMKGGNVNKLLSMCATKLNMLERRAEAERGSTTDVSRGITNYLMESWGNTVEYMQEGVRRKAQVHHKRNY